MNNEGRELIPLENLEGKGIERNPDNLVERKWDKVEFAHESEQEFARLLDFYRIKWLYEPVTFTVAWSKGDRPAKKFTPDFYLPRYGLFIEITTMNQKLVTKKNKKVRQLRECYPDVQCKVFYQRDYRNLLFKYGLTRERNNDQGSPP